MILSEDKFIQVYADFLILKEKAALSQIDSTTFYIRVDSLYSQHNVTTEQMQITLKTYAENIEKWQALHQKVIKRLEEIQR